MEKTKAVPIILISSNKSSRYLTGISGFDNLLGGGFVTGSSLLFAGEPGVGKSTFMLQVADNLAKMGQKVLYASGEENLEQIKLRADRLNTLNPKIWCSEAIAIEELSQLIKELNPQIIIVDSLQALYSKKSRRAIGSPSQMRDSLRFLIELAKKKNKILIVIGHSTKSGLIAGLLTLQHMVDIVFFMKIIEGNLREIFSKKNRFGASQYGWKVFMTNKGLIERPDVKVLKLEYNEIKEILDNSWVNKYTINSDMRWLFEKAFNKKLKNIEYDIIYRER